MSKRIHLYGLFLVLLSFGCNTFEKVSKSNDVNYKLSKANQYYDRKDYAHANELYQSLIPLVKGTRSFESVYYHFAYSYYYMKDYLSASYHFKNFTEFFPSSKDAEECQFMYALSLYKMSPKYSLEQANTVKAMEAMQLYINMHPGSPRIAEANGYIDQSRQKLEKKDADAARLYYDISQYKSAVVAYQGVLRDYPDSPNSDLYQFMILKSLYNYARKSIDTRQEERYASAIAAFEEFQSTFPKSKYLREAQDYHSRAQVSINQYRNEHK